MNTNYTSNLKAYDLSPRYSHRPAESNFNKPKPRESLPPMSSQVEPVESQYKSMKQPSMYSTANLSKQYRGYQSSQRNYQQYKQNGADNNNRIMEEVKLYQPLNTKPELAHYSSAKLLGQNKTNMTATNIGYTLSPTNGNNVNTTQAFPSNRKSSTRVDPIQVKQNMTTAELISNYRKSKQIIAETSFNQNKRQSVETADQSEQNSNKKMPRFSQPVGFPPNDDDNISKHSESNTISDLPSYSIKYNYSDKKEERDSFKQVQAFRKQKQLNINNKQLSIKDTISTHSKNNKLKSPRNFDNDKELKMADFIKGKELGSGKFGTVHIVTHRKTGFVCAMKTIPKAMIRQQNIINQFTRQIKIQSFLDHPNIIKLYGFFDDKDFIYLLLELGSQGQLYKLLKDKRRLNENTVVFLMKQLCDALKYLHSLNIIHRDIKPQNIVLQYGTVKLCDFGWAVHKGGELRSTFCGTPLYVSPEILKGQLYDEKIDIWSIGILTYELLVGEIPFQISNQQELIKIIKQDIVFPSNIAISNDAKDFVLKILKKNPEDRLKIGKLLQHQFLQRNVESAGI